MVKKWCVILLCLALFTQVTPLYAADDIRVMVSRSYVEFEKPPALINGRVLVQIRPIVQAIGCKVEWDDTYKVQYINTDDVAVKKVYTRANHIRVFVNNREIAFDQPPINISGYVFIPARYVCEALGFNVSWDDNNRIVKITEGAGKFVHIDSPQYDEPTHTPTPNPTATPTDTPTPTPTHTPEPTSTPTETHVYPAAHEPPPPPPPHDPPPPPPVPPAPFPPHH